MACLVFARMPHDVQAVDQDAVVATARKWGGETRRLADGSLMVTVPKTTDATAQTSCAAHIALAFHDLFAGLARGAGDRSGGARRTGRSRRSSRR